MKLFIDIETIKSSRTDLSAFFKGRIKPPANIKKPESIQKWWDEKSIIAINEKVEKTSLDGSYGEIISIAWALDGGEIKNTFRDKGTTEKYLLDDFCFQLDNELDGRAVSHWIGHNIAGFDLPFLLKRMILNRVAPPLGMPRNPKQWDNAIFDTSAEWAGYGNRISQDELCFILGLEMKPSDINGANVGEHYINENYSKIIEYNKYDVETVRNIYEIIK